MYLLVEDVHLQVWIFWTIFVLIAHAKLLCFLQGEDIVFDCIMEDSVISVQKSYNPAKYNEVLPSQEVLLHYIYIFTI